MKKMTIKNLEAVMEDLYECDKESYDELYHSMQVLSNLGLVDDNIIKAMVNKDRNLFNSENEY